MFSDLFALPIFSCFSKPERAYYNSASEGIKPTCIFCHVSTKNGFNIVHEDDTFVVFRDHRPAAVLHFLVTPKMHVESVKALTKSDVNMVEEMEALGQHVLDNLDIPMDDRRLGFHIPPFNSVNHLHLHVQALPYRSSIKRMKYPISKGSPEGKGFGWFVEIGQTIRILRRDGRVGVFPC
ncbi:hypothetical protein PLICRDRAFT_52867 [Plicaturopsis crispa FD-325 SS-3]|nr:hypothetical protein PLICRDRAFT_52867 [Plicaturopsis crispa FD-325 SS-3]